MNHSVIAMFALLTVGLLGCSDPAQQSTLNNVAERGQQNDIAASGKSSADVTSTEQDNVVFGDRFPEVMAAKATSTGEINWRFDVTLSSQYDSPKRYADAWRVLNSKGDELGIRVLGHDHASEQPFTRSGTV